MSGSSEKLALNSSPTNSIYKMRLLAVILLLIAYGSLYPGDFSTRPEGALQRFLTEFTWFTSLGDVLGNVALFFPLGMTSVIFLPAKGNRLSHIAGILFLVLLFAFILQLAQVWLPSRSAALTDVLWNMVGMTLGISVGLAGVGFIAKRRLIHDVSFDYSLLLPLSVLALWLLTELLPLVPSLDMQKIKDALKPLLFGFSFSFPQTMMHAAGAFAAGSAFVALRQNPTLWLGCALLFILVGKLIVVNLILDASTLIGMLAGYLGCLSVLRLRKKAIFEATLLLLLVAWTISAITPFSPTPGGTLNLVPLANMLRGSLETASRGLAQSLFIYTTLLWLMQRMGVNVLKAAVGFGLWASLLELMQMGLLGRTADVTEPLLLLLVGWMLSITQQYAPHSSSRPERGPQSKTENKIHAHEQRTRPSPVLRQRSWLIPLVTLFCFALPIWVLLRLPGIPYNLREMFLGDANFFFLLVFGGALLWYGAGAVWMSKKIAFSKLPFFQFPVWTFAVSLISLILLNMSITQESIDDIAGANNLYWFVVNQDIWGGRWRDFFQVLGPDIIGIIERWGRYTALYSPPLIFLVLILDFFYLRERSSLTLSRVALLIASALPWLWLAKSVTFDWSSTDNLNELIMRDGPMGWGGGGYLYALLGLLCANAVALAGAWSNGKQLPFVIIGSIVAAPLGWWLLNLGLEPNVEKYGFTFSGVQFLLGPDRQHLLTEMQLFVRWAAVHIGFILVTAVGIRIAWLNPFRVPSQPLAHLSE